MGQRHGAATPVGDKYVESGPYQISPGLDFEAGNSALTVDFGPRDPDFHACNPYYEARDPDVILEIRISDPEVRC